MKMFNILSSFPEVRKVIVKEDWDRKGGIDNPFKEKFDYNTFDILIDIDVFGEHILEYVMLHELVHVLDFTHGIGLWGRVEHPVAELEIRAYIAGYSIATKLDIQTPHGETFCRIREYLKDCHTSLTTLKKEAEILESIFWNRLGDKDVEY